MRKSFFIFLSLILAIFLTSLTAATWSCYDNDVVYYAAKMHKFGIGYKAYNMCIEKVNKSEYKLEEVIQYKTLAKAILDKDIKTIFKVFNNNIKTTDDFKTIVSCVITSARVANNIYKDYKVVNIKELKTEGNNKVCSAWIYDNKQKKKVDPFIYQITNEGSRLHVKVYSIVKDDSKKQKGD